MKNIVILGGGTAGTIMSNKLRKALSASEWHITIIDKNPQHYYQPGFLFIPFGIYTTSDVVKSKSDFFPSGVEVIYSNIEKIVPENHHVFLSEGRRIRYDYRNRNTNRP
jgi:sulfide:quinone oxidoreductase